MFMNFLLPKFQPFLNVEKQYYGSLYGKNADVDKQ
jgi:hypothetical protein